MTRTMYDAVTPSAIPTDATLVAGYVDGAYAWSNADWARFPQSVKVRIAVFPHTNDGHVLDVEQGDATPAQAPGWVAMRRAAGVDPTIYCSESAWSSVIAAFDAAGIAHPHWWVAAYPGGGAVIPAGAVAHQYADPPGSGGNFDISVVADYWPGIDPAKGSLVNQLVLAQIPGTPDIWVGDGITRRHVPDPPTLADVQHMIGKAGGDSTVQQIADLWVLGDPPVDVLGALSSEQAALLAAIKAQPTGGQVDVAAFATALAPVLAPLLPADATPQQVGAAVVTALADHLATAAPVA